MILCQLPFLALMMSGVMSAPGQYIDLMKTNNFNYGSPSSFSPPQSQSPETSSTSSGYTTSTTITTRESTVTTVTPRTTRMSTTTKPPKKIPVNNWGQKILIPNKPGSENFTNVQLKPEEEMPESKPLELEDIIGDNHYDDLLSYLGLDRMNMNKLKNLTHVKNVDEILDDESQRHLVEELGVDVEKVQTILSESK